MADIDFDDYGPGMSDLDRSRLRARSILNISGALVSLSLVLGMGYWGYRIALRDVTGIPVLRAMSEPMRMSPADPGGENTANQGLTVNAVASVGAVSALPEQLVLAPAPITLADDDAAGMGETLADMAALPVEPVQDQALSEASQTGADVLEPIEIAASSAPEMEQSQADAVALALAAALAEDGGAEMTAGGTMVASPRPRARPMGTADLESDIVASMDTVDATALAPESAASFNEVASADIPVGTRLVQLGAFDDRAAAEREWQRLAGQFGDLMTGKSLVVQEAQSGGRAFFRLRAHGFEDEDQARQFCAAVLAEGSSCIPVAQR